MPPSSSRRCVSYARLTLALLVCALVLGGIDAPAALAHAQLLGTIPEAGSTVQTQPPLVVFEYNQSVGFTLGAVRVYDASGREVDNGDVAHPNGVGSRLGVGLKAGLPQGTYTATYRVISADTHIVYGGLVFVLGHPSASSPSVASLIGRGKAGEVTTLAFGAVRVLDYVSVVLLIGALAFLVLVWVPARDAGIAGAAARGLASDALAARVRRLLGVAVVLGVFSSVLGILLEGAAAAGLSLWSSVRSNVIRSVLDDRFGWVWGTRAIVWLLLGIVLLTLAARGRVLALLGGSTPPSRAETRTVGGLAGLACAYIAITPALSGHGSEQSPVAVLFPVDVIHVVAVGVWVGGVVCLLFALPAATRELEAAQRSAFLVQVLRRFSAIALGCVVAIALTGGVQALILVRSLDALFSTAYGEVLLAKIALFVVLLGFGWVNRQRIIPALGGLVRAGQSPGGIGRALRRSLRGEGAVMLAVLGVTAGLIATTPAVDASSGPFSTTTTIGPAELQVTVDPAKVGINTIHVYLFDAKTGAQFAQSKELDVTATLPAKGIGPLPLQATASGPGHYTLAAAQLTPGGTWKLQLTDRVSAFDEYAKTITVPIR